MADRLRAGIGQLLRPSGPLPPAVVARPGIRRVLALALAGLRSVVGSDRRRQPARHPPATGCPTGCPPRCPGPFLPIEHDRTGWTVVMLLVVAAVGVPPPVPAGDAVGRAGVAPLLASRLRRRVAALLLSPASSPPTPPRSTARTGCRRWRACRWRRCSTRRSADRPCRRPGRRRPVPDPDPDRWSRPTACAGGSTAPTRAARDCPHWNANRSRRCAAPPSTNGPGSPASCTTW